MKATELQKEKMRQYRQANLEKVRAQDRERHLRDREKRNANTRRYYAAHKEELQAYQRERRADNIQSILWKSAKHRAKESSLPFDIEVSDVVVPDHCPVFGMPLVVGKGYQENASPSLDRVNPLLGYVKGNVWVISWRANNLKRDATLQELEQLVQGIKRRQEESL
jgi:hypothetical protein